MPNLIAREEIKQVLIKYAHACDQRAWALCDEVFDADVEVNYGGEYRLSGREAVVAMIKSMLGGCGPTQHLLGNFGISFDGDVAYSSCYVRAAHAGAAGKEDLLYEVWAEYKDELRCIDDHWLIVKREMRVYNEVGSRDVLGPAP